MFLVMKSCHFQNAPSFRMDVGVVQSHLHLCWLTAIDSTLLVEVSGNAPRVEESCGNWGTDIFHLGNQIAVVGVAVTMLTAYWLVELVEEGQILQGAQVESISLEKHLLGFEYQPIKWECYCGKNQYPIWYKSIIFFPCDNGTLPCQLRVHRRKLVFTAVVEIDFYRGTAIFTTVGNDSFRVYPSATLPWFLPCRIFHFLFMEMEIHSINQMEIFSLIFVL